MLEKLTARSQKEKHEEVTSFAKFKQWCTDTQEAKKKSVERLTDDIEGMAADVDKYRSDISNLEDGLAKLSTQLTAASAAQGRATTERQAEHKQFQEEHKNYSESVDALERALVVLKKHSADVPQATSLLAKVVHLKRVPASAKKVLAAFMQDPDFLSPEAPDADAYEFQSGGVVQMLEKLLVKFRKEKSDHETEEMNAKHAYDMLQQDLTGHIAHATADKNRRSVAKSKAEVGLAVASSDLEKATAEKRDDAAYLSDTNVMCISKSAQFQDRQKLRAEEIEALEKATAIIRSGVRSNAEKHGAALGRSFLQVKLAADVPAQKRALAYLKKQSRHLGSQMLAMVSEKVQEDPFAKVKKMIFDMVQRLMKQANEEAEHKGWCDTEMGTNKQTREKKQQEVDQLATEIEQGTADAARLTAELAELSQQVSELNAARSEATKNRLDEKAENEQTISDSKDAQMAVAQAIRILKTFYEKAGQAAFLEESGATDDAPETWDEAYTGQQESSGGIVGLLDVIESDFARLEAETKSSDDSAQREHEAFMADSSKDMAVKEAQIRNKTNRHEAISTSLVSLKSDFVGTQAQLDAALRYYDRLKPSCVVQEVSHEARAAKRQEEIESLRTALQILSDQ